MHRDRTPSLGAAVLGEGTGFGAAELGLNPSLISQVTWAG